MRATLPIKVSPTVLIWARESIGYTIEDVAKKLRIKPEKIKSWEKGKDYLTYSQLEKLAYGIYKRPLAVFFRIGPPSDKPIESDFRNLTSTEIENLSTELRLVVRRAKHLQNLIKELKAEQHVKNYYKNFRVSLDDNPNAAANRFRKFLGLSIEEQKRWNQNNSFDNFKHYVESIGTYVFQFIMPFDEARAFSLTNEYPVIALNLEDAKYGRIFSLFHEVCHILFNVSGVFRDRESRVLNFKYRSIENFCNRFASSFLIPEELFKKDIDYQNQNVREWSEQDLDKLSKLYSVSKEAILRKLVDLKLASKTFYFNKKRQWNQELRNYKEWQKQKAKEKEKKGGIPQDITTISEKGKPYVNEVLQNFESGNLTYSDVMNYLEIKAETVPKIIERIHNERAIR